MKIKHLKRQVGPYGPGSVREVGYQTGQRLIKYGLAEEVSKAEATPAKRRAGSAQEGREQMRVRFQKTCGSYHAGDEDDVPEKIAKAFIMSGVALPVAKQPPAPEPIPEPSTFRPFTGDLTDDADSGDT